jgi:hypothetical protein
MARDILDMPLEKKISEVQRKRQNLPPRLISQEEEE